MRKADYSFLTFILSERIARNRQIRQDIKVSEHDDICAKGELCALFTVAHAFADGASVDKAEFLKACGIKPHS
jgi:hypothetical protein